MSTYARGEALVEGRECFPDHVLVAQPAAGSGAIIPLDSRWSWRLVAARFLLTTSAVVANRFVTVDYCDPEGNAWVRNPALLVQAAGVANQEYDFGRRNVPISGVAGQPQFPELIPTWLPPGWQLRINVALIDVGDQLASIRLYVEKLLSSDV